jgi:hypothetical protein
MLANARSNSPLVDRFAAIPPRFRVVAPPRVFRRSRAVGRRVVDARARRASSSKGAMSRPSAGARRRGVAFARATQIAPNERARAHERFL